MENKVQPLLEPKSEANRFLCKMEHEEPHLTQQLKKHYELEAEVLGLLVSLEKQYGEYYDRYQCEMIAQRTLIERIWLLTQRYLILISSEQSCRYPEVYTLSTEEAIINEYEEKLEVVRASNNTLKNSLMEINQTCKKFYAAYDQLDKTQETPFIMGDSLHRSIKYHKIMAVDIFNYLYATVLKLKCYMHQLDPVNLESVEDYRELLQNESLMEEFDEYLKGHFVYCKCLKPIQTCPILKLKCSHKNLVNLKYVSRA
ncbi:LOW QUALITY PROTEIN: uncharacterized protein LOC108107153 [Drosophila eugracilis]|uniref:LOW QUALITY PROTEIN: uncharacterized protein LOC108107153 n=1 Tax=Drosophila eugracilis TaxID=29029 RepID=UPI001BDB3F64|nr:LOW QUALITY PROTEIN: uncharacterized protein LOC108107153 [Drosophila eugracilis]